jgi:hypothetical protein
MKVRHPAIKEPKETSVADGRKNLSAPAGVVAARELVRRTKVDGGGGRGRCHEFRKDW